MIFHIIMETLHYRIVTLSLFVAEKLFQNVSVEAYGWNCRSPCCYKIGYLVIAHLT